MKYLFTAALCVLLSLGCGAVSAAPSESLKILPEAGRSAFLTAFSEARSEIRIVICVLEDPQILAGLNQALARGVRVRVIVDNGKYEELAAERTNLANYLTSAGGKLHLSNPIFPRSFPKVILIDGKKALVGSACLDTTTFQQYRDYFLVTNDAGLIGELAALFENDWRFTVAPGEESPPLNPTPKFANPRLAIGPVSAAAQLTALIQSARSRLDVTSELLGNAALESELIAAVKRGVSVRLIAPLCVNGATPEVQSLQNAALRKLKAYGVQIRVTGPAESYAFPYMHARTMLADRARLYIGSISLSPNSSTFNREVGLFLSDRASLAIYGERFERDYMALSKPYVQNCPE